ncbi:MAG: DUF4242 domain-containing protein [Alphaproteobacteria bacterium]|nr:DUF4242 domain-containing protein [Alphaproteobacteria bacterium]
MPIFLDRHFVDEASAEDVAQFHVADLGIQDRYGVKFLTYWYDSSRRTTFCLIDAPDRETAERVHAEAHGHVANEIIEVDISAVEAFLGRVQDPPTAPARPIEDKAFRAIMFTDIVESTEMTERLGDQMAVELLRAHDGIVRRTLTNHSGREVKHLGDGIMAAFDHVPAAINSALAIQKELNAFNRSDDNSILVRIGVHAGEPIEEGNDLFGSAVQMAARLCTIAQPGGVLVSNTVRELCAAENLHFEPA